MSVKSTKKLAPKKAAGCIPPSAQVVAPPCLTNKETGSLPDSKLLAIMTAVVEASMRNFLSTDAWVLTFLQAKRTCKDVGISEEEFASVLVRLLEAKDGRFRANPLSSLF